LERPIGLFTSQQIQRRRFNSLGQLQTIRIDLS
jgi:hypothetical protein